MGRLFNLPTSAEGVMDRAGRAGPAEHAGVAGRIARAYEVCMDAIALRLDGSTIGTLWTARPKRLVVRCQLRVFAADEVTRAMVVVFPIDDERLRSPLLERRLPGDAVLLPIWRYCSVPRLSPPAGPLRVTYMYRRGEKKLSG